MNKHKKAPKKVKKPSVKKKTAMDLIMLLILILGIGAISYPFVSDEINNIVDQQIIHYYQKKANRENEAEMAKRTAEMKKKNEEMAKKGASPGRDPFTEAEAEVEDKKAKESGDIFAKHTIGVIRIPKIKVKLPIFDTTTELFLSQGSTLLGGTSYPTGGKSTHAVISAHRGLAKAKFFTDLPKLELKDQFYIEINNEILAYEVDQIKVVEPTETEDLQIVPGRDLVTLLTCTPYMVNSHRLLVRGHRIPYVPEMKKTIEKSEKHANYQRIALFTGLGILILLALYAIVYLIRNVMLASRFYDFTLVDTFHGVNTSYLLYTKNGKRQIFHEGQPVIYHTDDNHTLTISQLAGGNYQLVSENQDTHLRLKVKKLRGKVFVAKLLRKKKALVSLYKKEKQYELKKKDTTK